MLNLEKKWLTISETAMEFKTTVDYIEHYLVTEVLIASLHLYAGVDIAEVEFQSDDEFDVLPVNSESEQSIKGVYDIVNYSNLNWEKDTITGEYIADISGGGVYLRSPCSKPIYSVGCIYNIRKQNIIIRRKELERFKSENNRIVTHDSTAKYLDSGHAYYSVELAEAVKAWEAVVKEGVPIKEFKQHVMKRLKKADYTEAAVDRILILTNPDAAKNGGAPKKKL